MKTHPDRGAEGGRAAIRTVGDVLAVALALDLVSHASHSAGFSRLGFILVALLVVFVTVLTDRRPG